MEKRSKSFPIFKYKLLCSVIFLLRYNSKKQQYACRNKMKIKNYENKPTPQRMQGMHKENSFRKHEQYHLHEHAMQYISLIND